MVADGPLADPQCLTDLTVRPAMSDLEENLALSGR
jgi:hypothetical protein